MVNDMLRLELKVTGPAQLAGEAVQVRMDVLELQVRGTECDLTVGLI